MPLNFDVLCAVMPWIDRREDLLSYMSTCSDLYDAGIPILLGFRCVIGTKSLHPFYEFLISESPSSFLGLRSLCFEGPNIRDNVYGRDVTGAFTDILNQASNLQHLEITSIRLNSTLYRTLASLRSLRSLKLYTWDPYSKRQLMLMQLQSPLRSLEFDGPGAHLAVDVITTLASFYRTLKELTISRLTFCHNPAGPTYLNLTHLSLAAIGDPQLSILLPAFPNLQTLIIEHTNVLDDRRQEWRERNIQFQMDHPLLRWHLTSLTGDPKSLYILGLLTAVPDVNVIKVYMTPNLKDIEDCLATLRPMKLSINNDIYWLSEVVPTNCSELVRFNLRFTLPSDADSFAQHQAHLDSLFHQMNLLSISNSHLFFICIDIHGQLEVGSAMAQERNLAHDFLDSLDVDSFAARTVQAIPTLKIAELVLSGIMHTRAFHWNCNEGGGNTRIPSAVEIGHSPILDDLMAPMLQAYHSSQTT